MFHAKSPVIQDQQRPINDPPSRCQGILPAISGASFVPRFIRGYVDAQYTF